MRKIYFILIFVSICFASEGQVKVKFELRDIPKSKDSLPTYFVAGNFNSWKPNDTPYQFRKTNEGSYILEKQFPTGTYEFKITRGNWAKAETGSKGNPRGNRSLKLNKDTLVQLTVLNWADEFKQLPPNHTASVNVSLLDSAFEISQLHAKRRIWIYLPPSYTKSKNSYPVIYMHDGQNLFDEFTGGYGEWKVDEILDQFIANGGKECIVIGIDHGGTERLKEYNPYDSQYGKGKGKEYVEFLVKTLKPYIDQHYRTKPTAKNTSIAGSSMGGLISMYAIATYPKVFGNAGVFSPAFWLGKSIEVDTKKELSNLGGNKIYFVAGDLESKTMVSDMKSVYQILNPAGANKNIKFVAKADGEHKEWFWTRELLDFYKFINN
ncbi:alpha/beta hydrolase [Pedobacter polaris]|nr:alpha/beta hydrolase-fold protein [Pedobacter polaris]